MFINPLQQATIQFHGMGKFGQEGAIFCFNHLSKIASLCHSQVSARFTDWSYYTKGEAAVLMAMANTPKASILFTKRSDSLRRHPGQICFPGGMLNPQEGPLTCAIREAKEELNFSSKIVWPPRIIGSLGAYPNRPSKLKVHAFLAYLGNFERKSDLVSPRSLEEVKTARFIDLDELGNVQFESLQKGWHPMPFYMVGNTKIWGMTAYIIHEFTSKLNQQQ
jgi:8-oxo-dGTP pyrophosphatase MutT (NUDIX family)